MPALERLFPADDQQHPQTNAVRRVSSILNDVCAMLLADGLRYEAYNVHDAGGEVHYQMRHGEWVTLHVIDTDALRTHSDTALVMALVWQIKNPSNRKADA